MPTFLDPPTILDVEASGFGSNSYPIEIGVARSDGARFCRLIRPFSSWSHWDDSAEQLHGISRKLLAEYGADPVLVCRELNTFMGDRTAYSDGWVVDHPWLIKLFAEAGVRMTFRLSALEYVLNEYQMHSWHDVKQRIHIPECDARHRASVDAELIQKTFMATREASDIAKQSQAGAG
ncbi:hypothetical protein [Alteromonas antoniana]|uniref:3'-5' exonuclease n=1 Tax=Alteromonas antoniana TaxID=2803813 RepID=UPI001C4680FE|nr:hypothetical protein [Alteromonas antoniana]